MSDSSASAVSVSTRRTASAPNSGGPGPGTTSSAYLEVRYEELVDDPERVLRELVDALDEPWLPRLLVERTPKSGGPAHANSRISTGSVGRWRQDLNADERAAVQRIGGELLARLGYAAE